MHCVYCATNEATTRDHVPPKLLFPKTDGGSFRTVPACEPCNNGLSKDEEYFRILVCSASYDASPFASELVETKIKRSLVRPEQVVSGQPLLKQWLSRMELVDVVTPEGLYTGRQATKFSITDADWVRHYRVLTKMVKGLHFLNTNSVLPAEAGFRHVYLTDAKARGQADFIKSLNWKIDDVFSYGHGYVPGTYFSVHVLLFYKHLAFMSFVIPPEAETTFQHIIEKTA